MGIPTTVGASGVTAAGAGAVAGGNVDLLTNAETLYVGVVAGGKVGVSADACTGPSYCFPTPGERARALKKWEESMKNIPRTPPLEAGSSVSAHLPADYYSNENTRKVWDTIMGQRKK